jgi:hypothetical protein
VLGQAVFGCARHSRLSEVLKQQSEVLRGKCKFFEANARKCKEMQVLNKEMQGNPSKWKEMEGNGSKSKQIQANPSKSNF